VRVVFVGQAVEVFRNLDIKEATMEWHEELRCLLEEYYEIWDADLLMSELERMLAECSLPAEARTNRKGSSKNEPPSPVGPSL
jgi:hypothetical protein